MTYQPPAPPKIRRGYFRWVLLLLNGGVLAGIVFLYPTLSQSAPQLFTGNTAWFGLTLWGMILMIHVGLVLLLELREGVVISRKQRAYEQILAEYNRQKIKQRLNS
ncbi:MAG: hypothetical protein KJ043_20080 [Anaerolineae bacterium]|nr:hypothetical protein [Anaerolineae bacterium]